MAEGVMTLESPFPFAETRERVERSILDRGLTVFARIDHHEAARRQGLEMPEATVLVFGNPAVGTPAMLANPLTALDLPLRLLVWADEGGRASVSFQDPAFVAGRFGIPPAIPEHAAAIAHAALAGQA